MSKYRLNRSNEKHLRNFVILKMYFITVFATRTQFLLLANSRTNAFSIILLLFLAERNETSVKSVSVKGKYFSQ